MQKKMLSCYITTDAEPISEIFIFYSYYNVQLYNKCRFELEELAKKGGIRS